MACALRGLVTPLLLIYLMGGAAFEVRFRVGQTWHSACMNWSLRGLCNGRLVRMSGPVTPLSPNSFLMAGASFGAHEMQCVWQTSHSARMNRPLCGLRRLWRAGANSGDL